MIRLSRFFRKPALLAFALSGAMAGCGEESPPYEALPMRDALRAAPEVMATLPEESRREIATRFEEAAKAEDDPTHFARPEAPTLDGLVLAADDLREEIGKDALLFGEISVNEGGVLLLPEVLGEEAVGDAAPIEVRGRPGATTAMLEEAALKGRAGKALAGLAERTHAKSLVRMTGLPVGAVAWDETLYVNAAWLVALSSLEEAPGVVPTPSSAPGVSEPGDTAALPVPKPLSVDFNAYKIPGNLAECTAQVQTTCGCGATMSCSHEPTDPTFADANAECAWVRQATENATALCVLVLMDVDKVRQCVQGAAPQCGALSSKEAALNFVKTSACVSELDYCLQNGESSSTAQSSSCGEGTGCEDCRYCDDEGDNTAECIDDCATAIQLCAACAELCAACADSSGGKTAARAPSPFTYATVGAQSQCSMRPRPEPSPLPFPVSTALWLLSPVAYVLSRKARRP